MKCASRLPPACLRNTRVPAATTFITHSSALAGWGCLSHPTATAGVLGCVFLRHTQGPDCLREDTLAGNHAKSSLGMFEEVRVAIQSRFVC